MKAMTKKPAAQNFAMMPWFENRFGDWEQFWNRPFRFFDFKQENGFMPVLDVVEKKGKLMVNAELPGVTKDDVSVEFEDDNLVIRGEKRHEEETEEEGFFRRERIYGTFFRTLPLSFHAEPEKVKANFKDGVLKVEIPIPKAAKKPAAKQVQIS